VTDRESLQSWLDKYVAAWRSYDRGEIEALFTDDAEYWYHPYDDEAAVGAKAIADGWLDDRDSPGSWDASYEPYLIEGNRGIATGKTTYRDGRTFWNLWTLEFAPDGRCRHFVEWFMLEPASSSG
jgi:SnoaL-like domain